MAKAAILEVLNTTVGRYITNLNTQSLNVGLWSGSIELSNLSLDTNYINSELLEDGDVPIRVKSGNIEKISVKVPWTRITSKSVVLELKGLHVIVEPYVPSSSSSSSSEDTDAPLSSKNASQQEKVKLLTQATQIKKANRLKLLNKAEEVRKRQQILSDLSLLDNSSSSSSQNSNNNNASSSTSENKKSMTQKLIQRIVENLQIDVTDVRISLCSSEVTTGLTLENLSLYTTNEEGKRTFVDRTVNDSSSSLQDLFLRKELIVNHFGLYCNSSSSVEKKEYVVERTQQQQKEYIFQMEVLTLKMKLFQAASSGSTAAPPPDTAKYYLSSLLPSVKISLSHAQLSSLHTLTSTLLPPPSSSETTTIHPLFPEYRPAAPPLQGHNAKEWWTYACKCIRRLRRTSAWNDFRKAVRTRYEYVTLYQRTVYLHTLSQQTQTPQTPQEGKKEEKEVVPPPFITPLTPSEKSILEDIELDSAITVEGIMIWRTVAERRFRKLRELHHQKQREASKKSKSSGGRRRGKRSKVPSVTVEAPSLYGTNEDQKENSLVLLTPEELNDLEKLGSSAEQILSVLSSSSSSSTAKEEEEEEGVLYQVDFTLTSTQIKLSGGGSTESSNYSMTQQQPILTFETGKVNTSFVMNVNSSVSCLYELDHAFVTDDTTTTFSSSTTTTRSSKNFPYLLKSCNNTTTTTTSSSFSGEEKALTIKYTKNKPKNETELQVNLVAFEIYVLSHVLLELQKFGDFSSSSLEKRKEEEEMAASKDSVRSTTTTTTTTTTATGEKERLNELLTAKATEAATATAAKITDAINDVWESRLLSSSSSSSDERKVFICCELEAPIIYIPSSVVLSEEEEEEKKEEEANCIVADLGCFKFEFGNDDDDDDEYYEVEQEEQLKKKKRETRELVKQWFQNKKKSPKNKKQTKKRKKQKIVKSKCFAELNDVSLSVVRVSSLLQRQDEEEEEEEFKGEEHFHRSKRSKEEKKKKVKGDVLMEPIQLIFDVGTEQSSDLLLLASSTTTTSTATTEEKSKGSSSSSTICVYGALPSLIFTVSPQKLKRVMTVVNAWSDAMMKSVVVDDDDDGTEDKKNNAEESSKRMKLIEVLPTTTSLSTSTTTTMIESERIAQRELLAIRPEEQETNTRTKETSVAVTTAAAAAAPTIHYVPEEEDEEKMHVSFSLKRLSVILASNDDDTLSSSSSSLSPTNNNNNNNGIEANLISVTASATMYNNNNTSLYNLTMGYFWILNNLHSARRTEERKQRLVMHSTLPKPASLYAREENNYDVMDDLRKWGLFDDATTTTATSTTAGLIADTALAKIRLKMNPTLDNDDHDDGGGGGGQGQDKKEKQKEEEEFNIDLDANFTSLFVNVNIPALMEISSFATSFADVVVVSSTSSSTTEEADRSITTMKNNNTLKDSTRSAFSNMTDTSHNNNLILQKIPLPSSSELQEKTSSSSVRIRARIKSYEISLRHGRTDDEVFLLQAQGGSLMFASPTRGSDDVLVTVRLENGTCEDCCLEREHTFRHVFGPMPTKQEEDIGRRRKKKGGNDDDDNDNTDKEMMVVKYARTVTEKSSSDDVNVSFGSTQFVFSPETIHHAFLLVESISTSSHDDDGAAAASSTSSLPVVERLEGDDTKKEGMELTEEDEKEEEEEKDQVLDNTAPPDDESTKQISVSISASHCRVVLVDKASTSVFGEEEEAKLDDDDAVIDDVVSESSSLIKSSTLRLFASQDSESIVFQGKTNVKLFLEMSTSSSSSSLSSSSSSNNNISSQVQLDGKDLEIYTARGQDLAEKIQILEPQHYTLTASFEDSEKRRDVALKFVVLTDVVVDISMQDVSLLSGIVSSMMEAVPKSSSSSSSSSTVAEGEGEGVELVPLDDDELERIQKIAYALERSGESAVSDKLSPTGKIDYTFDDDDDDDDDALNKHTKNVLKVLFVTVDVKTPKTVVTVINDLQGMQQGLFKLIVGGSGNSFEGKIDIPLEEEKSLSSSIIAASSSSATSNSAQVIFRFVAKTSLLGDYFDMYTNQWEPYIVEPWDIEATFSRKYSTQTTVRMQTVFDVKMSSCIISFSEQLLVSLGAANRMWTTYSNAVTRTMEIMSNASSKSDNETEIARSGSIVNLPSAWKSSASSAARSLLVSKPYGIENHSGISAYYELKSRGVSQQDGVRHTCPTGTVQYFRFVPPRGNGLGGKRAYGQDTLAFKSIQIGIKGTIVKFQHLDEEVNRPPRLVDLGYGRHLAIDVVKKGKATIINIRSQVEIRNCTSLPINISVKTDSDSKYIGTCSGIGQEEKVEQKGGLRSSVKPLSSLLEGNAQSSKSSSSMGVPTGYLSSDPKDDSSQEKFFVTLELSPTYPRRNGKVVTNCSFPVPSQSTLRELVHSGAHMKTYEVTCCALDQSEGKDGSDAPRVGESITLQVSCKISLIGTNEYPFVELFLKPRALVQNFFPMSLSVRTAMPVAVRGLSKGGVKSDDEESKCKILPNEIMEIFSTDLHLSLSLKCGEVPIAGAETGWADIHSDDLVLDKDKSLEKPFICFFPSGGDNNPVIDFYIAEAGRNFVSNPALEKNSEDKEDNKSSTKVSKKSDSDKARSTETSISNVPVQPEACRTFYIAAFNTAVDHTGEVLLERYKERKKRRGLGPEMPSYLNMFSSANKDQCTMILPQSSVPICAHKAGKIGGERATKSLPFSIDQVTLCQGTSDFSLLVLEDQSPSGYYMYKELQPHGGHILHIVHEFLIYNGDEDNPIAVNQTGKSEFTLEPGKVHPLRAIGTDGSTQMTLSFPGFGAVTETVQVDAVGMKVCQIKSKPGGPVVGKVDIETVLGKKCARFVIRVGGIQFGNANQIQDEEIITGGLFTNDYLHFKMDLLRTEVTIYDTGMTMGEDEEGKVLLPSSYTRVAQLVMDKFIVNYDRFYEKKSSKSACSIFSASLRKVHVSDCTEGTKYPDVLDTSSQKSQFMKLYIQSRESTDVDLVRVDHFDLMLSSYEGIADPIVFKSSEEFIWKLLDVVNRTISATAKLAGVDASLEWDEDSGEYVVVIKEDSNTSSQNSSKYEELKPPQSQIMYDVKEVKISPLALIVSFKRQPQASRYGVNKNESIMGEITNYFTSQLQFTIQEAQLSFAGYQAHNIRGPSSQITDMVRAAYTSQLKFKIATLLSSATLQDWKYLSGREDKGDEYVEGDILRLTGNLTGKSAGFILKTTGKGIGVGFSKLASAVGGGIQSTTELFGAGVVGAGVNSVLSGVGGGVGSTIEGVGVGAGKVISGAAKGIGDVAGGVGGGVLLMAKGKVGEGASSAAQGVGTGVETLVQGTVDGVGAAGTGLFSGIKKICGGVAGAFPCFDGEKCKNGSCTIS